MAEDPNGDILLVKEGSSTDTILAGIDPRERHLVCKLDRYQLEDKYLRLLDEANNLKKLSNCQEDKIKRLGTKLLRLAGNPRSCGSVLEVAEDKNRIALELENTKLKEKIAVMRNQLLSHTMSGRSSSRSRNLTRPTSSGLMTCRSENNRVRTPSCQCIVDTERNDGSAQNYLVKIEKLEAQKKDMASRLAELEKELALYTSDSQREKVAENVEYIRVWRQMKQLNDKLITAQDKNTALTTEINGLKKILEQTTRNNQEIAAVLTSERTRIAEIDDQMLKAKNSQLTVREKDEQIRDLISEIKILQQHNNELIVLTSKYGQFELENVELRKKLSEHVHEQRSLKTAYNNEQANIVALQTINEQLLAKLQDLQANIDTLTAQLTTLHQKDKRDAAMTASPGTSTQTTSETQSAASKRLVTFVEQCKRCKMYSKVERVEKIVVDATRENWQPASKSVQTDASVEGGTKEQGTVMTPQDEWKARSRLQSPERKWTGQEANGTSILSREKILKLLDQAQINVPLEVSRIAQREEYTNILDVAQRHSEGEVPSRTFRDESSVIRKTSRKVLTDPENPSVTSGQILLILFDVLQEYLSFRSVSERESPCCSASAVEVSPIDLNNNHVVTKITRDVKRSKLDMSALTSYGDDVRTTRSKDRVAAKSDRAHEDARTDKCTCDGVNTCRADLGSDCCSSCVPRVIAVRAGACKEETVSAKDVGCSPTRRTYDATCLPTMCEKRGKPYRDITDDFCAEKAVRELKVPSPRRPKCNLTCHMRKDAPLEREEQELLCRIKCMKNCAKLPICPAESFPLLITDSQGLVEIHIMRLQLSTSAAEIPEKDDICNLLVYISWDIWNEKTACTPRLRCPNLNFDSSSVYRIADLFSFFKNVLSENLVFRVNLVRLDGSSYTFARAKVSIKDILDYPQNKLHYIVPVSSVVSRCAVNFGQLSLWVRLSCNVDMVEAFKKQCGISSLQDLPHPPRVDDSTPRFDPSKFDEVSKDPKSDNSVPAVPDQRNLSAESNSREIEDSDDEMYYVDSNNHEFSSPNNDTNEMSNEGNNRNPTSDCPDAGVVTDVRGGRKDNVPMDSSSMVQFKSLFMNAGSNVPLLEGSSSTSVCDMNEIISERNWQHYRQMSLLASASAIRANSSSVDARDRQRDASTCELEGDTIVIEIVSMLLFEGSIIMRDDEIRLLFVEYSFLGHYGENMESASVEKPRIASQEMVYNFRKKFSIDQRTHAAERDRLRSMLSESTSPIIKFIVVSDPLPEETDNKECVDVGVATFNIKDYVHGDGNEVVLLSIKDDRNRKIGVLKIIVLGFDAIRQCLAEV